MKCDDCEFARETIGEDVLRILKKNTPHMVRGLKVGMISCAHYYKYINPKEECTFYQQEVEEEEDW